MADFIVREVFDGSVFAVSPNWEWQGQKGYRVCPTGYDAPKLNEPGGETAKRKLSGLILSNTVDLRNICRIGRGCLVANVYFQGKNLADYFPEYKT